MADQSTLNSDDISTENQQLLAEFQQITGKDDTDDCRSLLEKHSWNMEAAVQSVFSQQEGIPSAWDNIETDSPSVSQAETATIPHNPNYSVGTTVRRRHERQTWMSWLLSIPKFPYTILHISISFLYHTASEFILFVVRIIWPGFGRVASNPVEDVTKFKDEYEKKYGTIHPTFYLGSYGQVLSDSRSELKFVLVYLHCDQHQNTPDFCRNVLCNPAFRDYTINKRALFWACDINSNEGRRVSRAMRERTYPFIAVVCLRDNRMTVVWRIEGCIELDPLIAVCEQVFHDNEASLVAARADRDERNLNRDLRSQQDKEFIESLETDKRKMEERKKEEDAGREAERIRQDKENEKQRKIEDLAKRREDCRDKFASLVEPCQSDEGAIKLRIKLSNGECLQRLFLKSDYLQDVYDYVLCNENSPGSFQLCTNFPRHVYALDANNTKTLELLGIKRATQFFVHDLTSDDEYSDEEE